MGHIFDLDLGNEKLCLSIHDKIHQFRHSWDCQRHSNADFELHIILRGSCNIDVEDYRYALQDHQAIIIAPGQYHRPAPAPGEFERLSMSFSLGNGALLEDLRTVVSSSRIYPITPQITSICQDIFRESASQDPFCRDMLQALLAKLLICNLRILRLKEHTPSQISPDDPSVYTQLIDDFFEVHLADNITAEALASELHLSRRQLTRVLQQTYGMGFREKLIRTRMDHAAWLLRSTESSISEIAEQIGYSSEAALYQVFRAKFQMTPQQYRLRNSTIVVDKKIPVKGGTA